MASSLGRASDTTRNTEQRSRRSLETADVSSEPDGTDPTKPDTNHGLAGETPRQWVKDPSSPTIMSTGSSIRIRQTNNRKCPIFVVLIASSKNKSFFSKQSRTSGSKMASTSFVDRLKSLPEGAAEDGTLVTAAAEWVASTEPSEGRGKLLVDIMMGIIDVFSETRSDVFEQLRSRFLNDVPLVELYGVVCYAIRKQAFGLIESLLANDALYAGSDATTGQHLHHGRRNLTDHLFIATINFSDFLGPSDGDIEPRLIRALEFVARFDRPGREIQPSCIVRCVKNNHARVLEWLVRDSGLVSIEDDDTILDGTMELHTLNRIIDRHWNSQIVAFVGTGDDWSVLATVSTPEEQHKGIPTPKYDMVRLLIRLGARVVFPNGYCIRSLALARRLGLVRHEQLLLGMEVSDDDLRSELVDLVQRLKRLSLNGIARQMERGTLAPEAVERLLGDRWRMADVVSQPVHRERDLLSLGHKACVSGHADAVRTLMDIGLDKYSLFQSKTGDQCLQDAVRKGHVEALRVCLERCPCAPSKLTGCLLAQRARSDEMKCLLVEFGARADLV